MLVLFELPYRSPSPDRTPIELNRIEKAYFRLKEKVSKLASSIMSFIRKYYIDVAAFSLAFSFVMGSSGLLILATKLFKDQYLNYT